MPDSLSETPGGMREAILGRLQQLKIQSHLLPFSTFFTSSGP